MKRWRVGTITFGIMLIVIGIVFAVSRIYNFSMLHEITKWWPVVLVALGIEILAWNFINRKENSKMSIDGFSITMISITIILSIVIYSFGDILSGFPFSLQSSIPFSWNYKYNTIIQKNYTVDSKDKIKFILNNEYGNVNIDESKSDNIEISADIKIKNNDEELAKKIADSIVSISNGETVTVNSNQQNNSIDRTKILGITIDYTIKIPKNLSAEVNDKFGDISVSNISKDVGINDEHGNVALNKSSGNASIINSFGDISVEDVSGSVNIENRNGDIKCKNTGSLKVKNKFADIKAESIKGNAELSNSNGNINITNADGNVIIDNSFGDIKTVNASGNIDIKDKNGNIKVENSAVITKNVVVNNEFGDIILTLSQKQDGKFKASDEFGDIHSSFNLNISKKNNDKSLNGTIGTGTASFDLITKNGDITIKK